MDDIEDVAGLAIRLAKRRGLAEVGADQLLEAGLRAVGQFGTVTAGAWMLDLEAVGVDWLAPPGEPAGKGPKVSYSDEAVDLLDRAAAVAKADGASAFRPVHLLVAFAGVESGLMAEVKRTLGIGSAEWRAGLAQLRPAAPAGPGADVPAAPAAGLREFLTPEEAAEALGLHVQTLRAYVRSGKLPAARLAGERAIRIRRSDLEKVLEPLVPEK